MKVAILAGGRGTRLGDQTQSIPKPLVQIGGKPILWHLMNIFAQQGFDEFIVALGHKGEKIKEFFLDLRHMSSDLNIDLAKGTVEISTKRDPAWKVHLVDTGEDTMTGGRLRRLKPYLSEDTFMATYGDGLCNVNLNKLTEFHKKHGKLVTITAVRPLARFGELSFGPDGIVNEFKEKPQTNSSWINGGFFVMNPKFLQTIKDDYTELEREPLELAASQHQLVAFEHKGFWQCMDTPRDKELLEQAFKLEVPPWSIFV